ncbi:MAG: CDP-glycerol glycerophosphotransferase family protein, partial [Propionibacteriaceae bacterium]|nr:CDP-glycerol glycerophosphotransferase family protein [Propionibacteriaceae bacterium]
TVILRRGKTRIDVLARHHYESEANVRARLVPVDYGHFGFTAVLDLAPLLASADAGEWQVVVQVDSGDRTVSGPFRSRVRTASAAYLTAHTVDGVQLLPRWDAERGLTIAARRPAALEVSTNVSGRRLVTEVATHGLEIAHAVLVSPRGRFALAVRPLGDSRFELSGDLPECLPDGPTSAREPGEREPDSSPEAISAALPVLNHRLEVTDTAGSVTMVNSSLDDGDPDTQPGEALYAYAGPDGAWLLRDTPAMLLIDTVELQTEGRIGLRLEGRVLGDLAGARLMLTGPRIDIGSELSLDGERFSAFVPMLVRAWGGPELAPQSGRYVVRGQTAQGAWFRVAVSSSVIARAPRKFSCEWFKLRTQIAPGGRLAVQLGAPLGDKEIGEYQQAALKLRYHEGVHSPVEAIYFETFGARAATCNPYALDREIARRYPDLPRYWGVLDRSVAVPEGAIPVLKGTKDWWEARSTCRYVIINEWIRQKFKHQP